MEVDSGAEVDVQKIRVECEVQLWLLACQCTATLCFGEE